MKKRILFPLLLTCLGLGACANSEYDVISPEKEVEYVEISESSLSIKVGESFDLSAYTDGTGTITWINGDSSVVSLDPSGENATVTGVGKGTAIVSVISGGKIATCTITVGGGNAEPQTIILLSETSKSLDLNEEFLLTATVSGSSSAPSFTSSNPNVAKIEMKDARNAKITGVGTGSANIDVKVGTRSATCVVTVSNSEATVSISLNKSSLSVEEGQKDASLIASVKPSNASISWQSSHEEYATVSSSGVINAIKAGKTTISATVSHDGVEKTAVCEVTVTAKAGDENYDEQIATWSQSGHLYFHYKRTSDTNYDRWAIWAWPNYPDDGEGSLWGWNGHDDTKGIIPQTTGWMKNSDCGLEGDDPYCDEYGQVMDLVLDSSLVEGGVVGGRTQNPAPLIADYLWNDPLFLKAAIGFLIVDQEKMDGSDMWTSDGGAESYIKKIGKLMPEGRNSYLHVYAVEGNVSDFTTSSGAHQYEENKTLTDTTGKYRSVNNITNLKADAWKNGVATSTSFLDDEPGVGYQIFVPSFADSDGDGYGDLRGIINKLDYLEDLGVDVLWLTPIQESNSYHGYDVTDYYKIDQRFGTLKDYQELIYRAHSKGMKVLMDMVINHTSKSNVLYKKSQRADVEIVNGKEIKYRNMYLWKYQGDPILEWDGVEADANNRYSNSNPANFVTKQVEESSDWYRDGTSNYYYYGKFGSGMAELNYSCQETRDYMTDMCKYWLSFGLDGFRLDAIKHIYLLSELDPTYKYQGDFNHYDVGYRTYYNVELDRKITVANDYSYDRDLNVMFWKQFAGTLKSAYPNCFLVGENFDGWNQNIAPFYQAIDSQFDFSTYYHLNESTVNGGITAMGGDITATLGYNANEREKAINGAFTSNHDVARLLNHAAANSTTTQHAEVNAENLSNALNRARWFAATTIFTPGLSWIYYGDELGLCGNLEDTNVIGFDGQPVNIDDKGNNLDRWYRQPMRWGREYGKDQVVKYGFGGLSVLWDNISSNIDTAEEQHNDPASLYNYFKAACHAKNDSRFPSYGKIDWTGTIGGDTNTLTMQISGGNRTVIVLINANEFTKEIETQNRGDLIGCSNGSDATHVAPYGFVVVAR